MTNKTRWSDRIRYWVDNTFSRGTIALVAWLAVCSLVVILLAAAALTLAGFNQEGVTERLAFGEAAWEALMRTFDAGTMGGDTGWGYRWVMLFVTIGGIFIISTLIGVLTNAVEDKVQDLRKGRSRVIEHDHTVILGWSEQIFTLLSEIRIANENQKNACIVILADKDKVEMEDAIRDRIGSGGNTRIVCRTGSPAELVDLKIASLDTARSIIVLSPDTDEPDAEVIKVALAITHDKYAAGHPRHVVAELIKPQTLEVAGVIGRSEIEWVQAGDVVARIVAQTCRQSGLSVVYTELLDFGGDEIYFTEAPELVGKTYGEALDCYEKNAVMGISLADGSAQLNPPMKHVLKADDKLVVLAGDDDQIWYKRRSASIQEKSIVVGRRARRGPERSLILGWNRRGPIILRELDHYVAPGSKALVLAETNECGLQAANAGKGLKNLTVKVQYGDTVSRKTLENLQPGKYDHVILLSCLEDKTVQQADSRTLVTLLHLRDLSDKQGLHFSITSEMQDVRNRDLAEVTRADDFIVSGQLISLMLAQISENKYLHPVLKDLFDPEGAEVYLKPVAEYLKPGQPVNFYTVIESARRRNETAIGYRRVALARDASQAYGVVLNPLKTEMIRFDAGDKIVVLAES